MSYLGNNSKSVLFRVIHASSRNNPQMSLASTMQVYFLLMQSLMSWAGSCSPSHYLGLQAACILQLHCLRAAVLLWPTPINKGSARPPGKLLPYPTGSLTHSLIHSLQNQLSLSSVTIWVDEFAPVPRMKNWNSQKWRLLGWAPLPCQFPPGDQRVAVGPRELRGLCWDPAGQSKVHSHSASESPFWLEEAP